MRFSAAQIGLFVVLGVFVLALGSCANPVPPRGGPEDETPPSVVETRPVRDTVNVSTDTRTVYVEFSEYVERSTFPQSLSVIPRFEEPIRFDWSGQGVGIELPASLRDSTTYLFTIDKTLRDAHGVSLENPITIAFSTGPRINRGQIRGRVVEPQEGAQESQMDVFAYALPSSSSRLDTLPDRPTYRTQTAEDGTFTFDYMREQSYYVVALRDNNRNRRPDPQEPFAVPPRRSLSADSGSAEVPVPWLLTRVDTLAPRYQQVRPLSRQRLRLSFNEPVQLTERSPSAWVLRDSVTKTSVPVRAVYRSPDRRNAVILRTASMESNRHALALTSPLLADTLGQGLVPDTARFQAISRDDTTQTRFRTFLPEELSTDSTGAYPLLADWEPGVRFNQTPDSSVLRQVISVQDTAGNARSYTLRTDDGRRFWIQVDPPLESGAFLNVAVDLQSIAGPDTSYSRQFRRVTDRMLGALEGRAILADTTRRAASAPASPTGPSARRPAPPRRSPADSMNTARSESTKADSTTLATSDTSAAEGRSSLPDALVRGDSLAVELIPTESDLPLDSRRLTVYPGSTFVFSGLPEATFRFRAFLDRNENERWDGGRIHPYVPAEPVTWSASTTDSRPRWTNVIPAPLRIPILRPDSLASDSSASPPAPDTTAADSLDR